MKKKLKNISDKIESLRKDVLIAIHDVAIKQNTKFLVVGATARDIILQYCNEVDISLRATEDIDIAINVSNWESFEKLKRTLIEQDIFTETNIHHRVLYQKSIPVDIVPFGEIEKPDGRITIPPEHTSEMTLLGFTEALNNAQRVALDNEAKVIVSVADLENLFIMKLISWDEKYPERERDAFDMQVILEHYLDGNNQYKLFEDNDNLLEEDTFNFELAAARVLGRDIAKTSASSTLSYITIILKEEADPDGDLRLVSSLKSLISTDIEENKLLKKIQNILMGIDNIVKK